MLTLLLDVDGPANRRGRETQIFLTVDGETASIQEWAKRTGLKESAIRGRLRRGDDHARAVRPMLELTVAERFFAHVDKSGPMHPYDPALGRCWLWTGARNRGYGKFQLRTRTTEAAHRVAWELANGPIAAGYSPHDTSVCHSCDVRLCVNDAHLFLGTAQDNADDRGRKGRTRCVPPPRLVGAANPRARLTEADVAEIRASDERYAVIAAKHGISRVHVSQIRRRVCWKEIAC